jgi:hypothetical protein
MLNAIRVKKQADGEIAVELPDDPLYPPSPPEVIGIFPAPPQGPFSDEEGIVTLGVPQAVELASAPSGDSTGLMHFLEIPETMHYFLVYLACSFHRAARWGRLLNASLKVTLTREDGIPEPTPLAWSMEPICLPHITELSRSQRIDASFKVISASVGREQKSTETRCLVRAFNELQPDPRWEFRPTKDVEILGTQRLMMVVQTPERFVNGEISLTAQLQSRRRSMMFRHETKWVAVERWL